ncbi:MAG TPA: ubiquinol-cytochrome c reductase iron-sulfur subunit [Geobacteraceae bacterium]
MKNGDRRRFLISVFSAFGVSFAAMAVYPVFRFLTPRSTAGDKGQITIPRDRVGEGQAYFFQFRGHPAVILQRAPGDFVAFSAICTHLGCVVRWVGDKKEFLCPCHGGRYGSDGKVLGGPPPKPLPSIPVALSGANLLLG